MQIKVGDFAKTVPGRGTGTGMVQIESINPSSREATYVYLNTKKRETMYLAHLYTDMECFRARQEYMAARASKIGTKGRR